MTQAIKDGAKRAARGETKAAKVKRAEQGLGTLGPDNFREWAKDAIAKYNQRGMIVDAMAWSRIVALYEEALAAKVSP